MVKKKNIRIIMRLFLLALVIYLIIPYQPSLDPVDKLVIHLSTPDGSRELTGIEKKQMYDILSHTKYRKISLYIFPQSPVYHDDYYAIFVGGNRSYDQIDFFPYGDSYNGRQPYGFIRRYLGPDRFFVLKQLIVNVDEFTEELKAHGFI
jgi:hypothetical protein